MLAGLPLSHPAGVQEEGAEGAGRPAASAEPGTQKALNTCVSGQ